MKKRKKHGGNAYFNSPHKENGKIKDSVFTDLFGECEEAKRNALSLFNALNDSDYSDYSLLEHFQIKDTIYKNFRNDVSFRYGDRVIVLIEHQSTVNYNMPLRALMYIGRLYEKLVPVKNRYRRKKVMLLKPEFFVLYNGDDDTEPEYTLKLSDSFINSKIDEGGLSESIDHLEVKVKVININKNKNHPILKKCPILDQYSSFMNVVKECVSSGMEDPYKEAVKKCINSGVLADYLLREGSEVVNMLIAEYDYDMDIEVQREEAYFEGREEGRQEGREEGREEGIEKLNNLNACLIRDNRMDDLKKSLEDKEYQKQLLEEYGL